MHLATSGTEAENAIFGIAFGILGLLVLVFHRRFIRAGVAGVKVVTKELLGARGDAADRRLPSRLVQVVVAVLTVWIGLVCVVIGVVSLSRV
jgi:hypothetical protein